MITENLEQVRKNIEEACRAVNRDPGEVTLISVSWINIHSSRQIFAGI